MIATMNNLQHIGIPTKKYEATLEFYRLLGFTEKYTTKQLNGKPVAFYELGTLCMEIYESDEAAECYGAIDHVTIDCSNVDEAYAYAQNNGLKIVSDGLETLPYWDNGIRFFKVEGPNKEIFEVCQIL